MEKKVISNNATCGVYVFKNIKELLNAIAWYMRMLTSQDKQLDYIAPILNYFQTPQAENREYTNIIDPN